MKISRIKRVSAIAMAGLMACGVTACNSSKPSTSEASSKTITLSVINYHVGTDYATSYFNYLFQEFPKTAAGKNVKFKIEQIPTTDAYNQKLKLLIASGDLPDIVLNGGNNYTELAAKSGKVVDLTPYYNADPAWKEQFDPKSLTFNTVNDKIYGVPTSKEISYIYYNKDLFKKAGLTAPEEYYATWDDFFKACDTLKSKGITPLGMDSADYGWLSNLWLSALIGTSGNDGKTWMNSFHPKDYNTTVVVNATTRLQKMLTSYTTTDAVGGKYDQMATHFFNSQVAMLPNGPWMIPDLKNTEKAPAGFYDKVGVMLLPTGGMEMVPTPGDMVGAKEPEKIKAAVAFLKFETSLDNQVKALEMTGLQPESPKVKIPDSLKQSDPLMATVLQLAPKATVTYSQNQASWYQNTLDTFSMELPELANNNITPSQFCEKLSEAARKNSD